MIINKQLINDIKLENIIEHCGIADKPNFLKKAGDEHYRLLAYLSSCFSDSKLVEIGTRYGSGAAALGFNPSNTVCSYDIKSYGPNCKLSNVNFILKNVLVDGNVKEIIDSPLIFIDVEPHDGLKEAGLLTNLIKFGYKGVLLCDDILDYPNLKKWWDSITLEKYDITEYGHFSGTGLVNFSEEEIILQ